MASPRRTPGSGRAHSRNVSQPQRTEHDPLAVGDDPLTDLGPPSQRSSISLPPEVASQIPSLPQSQQEQSNPRVQQQQQQPQRPQQQQQPSPAILAEPFAREAAEQKIDLSFLQDRGKYHSIPIEDIPDPFLRSPLQPPLTTPLTDLIQHGHFRRAAEVAVTELLALSPDDVTQTLQLLHTRLACLILISRADIASHEASALTEYLAHNGAGARELLPLIPWELRLLLVRLQTIAAADGGRRSIMALYSLASEVRGHIRGAKDSADEGAVELWTSRLRDLGLRVADTLVEMGELETATRHLETLTNVAADELAYRIALLRLRVGDTKGAEDSIAQIGNEAVKSSLEVVLDVANGDVAAAVERLQNQSDSDNASDNELIANNLGVGLLYTGRIDEARDVFTKLAEHSSAFHGLLFNLSTIYELCTERAGELKMDLARQMAAKEPTVEGGGWERAAFELKL